MSNLCGKCGHLVKGNSGDYFMCTSFQIKRMIPKKVDGKKTYFNVWSGFNYRMAPINLKMNNEGRPLKCRQCIRDEAKLREMEASYV